MLREVIILFNNTSVLLNFVFNFYRKSQLEQEINTTAPLNSEKCRDPFSLFDTDHECDKRKDKQTDKQNCRSTSIYRSVVW